VLIQGGDQRVGHEASVGRLSTLTQKENGVSWVFLIAERILTGFPSVPAMVHLSGHFRLRKGRKPREKVQRRHSGLPLR